MKGERGSAKGNGQGKRKGKANGKGKRTRENICEREVEMTRETESQMVARHLKVITVRVQFAPTCKRQGELVYWLAS